MTAKVKSGGLRLAFTTDELASVRYNGRTGRPRRGEIKRLWSRKLLGLILRHYHDVADGEIEEAIITSQLLRLHLPPQRRITSRPFNFLKIEYKLSRRSRTINIIHFYFETERLGVSGVLHPYRYSVAQEQ